MKVLAIIPARGGSKGVPGKNVRLLAGRPLLAWSVAAAKASKLVSRVVVSSDRANILAAAMHAGAETVLRPQRLATDEAPTDPVLVHVLHALYGGGVQGPGYRPDLVVLLQPTVPLRPAGLIDACITRLLETGADSLFTGTRAHFVWSRVAGELRCNAEPLYARPRRQSMQDSQVRWLEDGSVYVTRTELLEREHTRLGGRVEIFENDAPSIDIDTEEDWHRAELEISGDLAGIAPATPYRQLQEAHA